MGQPIIVKFLLGTANTENGIASRDEQQRRDSLKQPPVTNEHQQHGQVMGQVKTVKYKALYEFNARSVDELSIQPGDLILVFEGHKSEPGWLGEFFDILVMVINYFKK